MPEILREKIAADYDQIATAWDKTRKNVWGEVEFLKPSLTEKISILDAGCGNGRLLRFFERELTDFSYLGVDFSAGLLTCARQNFPQHDFQQADLVNFQPEKEYDLVTSFAVLHHLPTRAEQLAALKNLHAALRPGGQLFLTAWNLWQPRFFCKVLKSYFTGTPRLVSIPFQQTVSRDVFALAAGELKKLLREAGFSEVEVFYSAHAERVPFYRARNLTAICRK